MEQRARQDDLVKFECMENELRARVAQLEDELAAVKIRAAEDTEAQLIELKNAKDEMATMAAETVQLREWKSSREEQFAELNAKLESIQAHSLQSPLKTTPSKRETNASVSTGNVLEDLNVRISEKVELNSKLKKEVDALAQERTELEDKVTQLSEEMAEMEKENEDLRSQCSPLQERTNGRFASILSPISPMSGYDSPDTPGTPNSDDVEAVLEREQGASGAAPGNGELEQMRSHMEYSVLLSFVENDAQDAGFSRKRHACARVHHFSMLTQVGHVRARRTSLLSADAH